MVACIYQTQPAIFWTPRPLTNAALSLCVTEIGKSDNT